MRMTSALAALLLLCAMGCGNRAAVKGVLDSAEAIMNERPDSALVLLENIDSSAVRGRATAARYSLLRSMALDKNVIDTADISIILPAVRYYERKGDDLSKARTFFYYGRVLQNGGDNEAALEAVSKAELYADRTGDLYLQGLIADCKGRIYESSDELDEALQHYVQAADAFRSLNLRINEMYMLEMISGIYDLSNDSEKALEYAQDARNIALETGDASEIISTTLDVALAFYVGGDFQKALSELTGAADVYFSSVIPSSFYMLLSQIFLSMGDIASARDYAMLQLEIEKASVPSSAIYALLEKIEYAAGNYKLSCEYYDKCLDAMDIQRQIEYEESVHEADMRYKNGELREIIKAQEKHLRDIIIIWSLAIVSVAAIGLAAVQMRRRQLQKNEAEINEYRNKISTLQEYSALLEKVKNSVPEKNELINHQVEVLSKLMSILVRTQSKMKPPEYREFVELVRKRSAGGDEILNTLRSTFDIQYPEVKGWLRDEHLSEKDMDIYMLTNLGCSASVTAYIIGTTEGYIFNRRSMLRKKFGLTDEKMSLNEHIKIIQRTFKL